MSNRDAADNVILDAEEAIQYWERRKPIQLFDGFTGLVRICDSERWEEPGLIRARAFNPASAPTDSNLSGNTGSGGGGGGGGGNVAKNMNASTNPAMTKAATASGTNHPVQISHQQNSMAQDKPLQGEAAAVIAVSDASQRAMNIPTATDACALPQITSAVPPTQTAAEQGTPIIPTTQIADAQSISTLPATETTAAESISTLPRTQTTAGPSAVALASTQALAAQELGVDLADLMSLEADNNDASNNASTTDASSWLQEYLSVDDVGGLAQQPANATATDSMHDTSQHTPGQQSAGGEHKTPASSKQTPGSTGQPIMTNAALKKAIVSTAVRAAKLEIHNQMDWVDDLPSAPTQPVKLAPKPPSNP